MTPRQPFISIDSRRAYVLGPECLRAVADGWSSVLDPELRTPKRTGVFDMEIQTESYIVLGGLPNEERYHCLICGCTPDRVMVDLFVPEPKDIPASVPLPNS